MNLKLIENHETPHAGYGAGGGRIILEKYECPCGKGIVTYEKDDIPGFRESDIYCDCKDCSDNYSFARGIAKNK